MIEIDFEEKKGKFTNVTVRDVTPFPLRTVSLTIVTPRCFVLFLSVWVSTIIVISQLRVPGTK